ncbi:hypothetical protein FSW04_09450 [Baekduia soli]|uniref:Cupin domain-containing protein n=1 Tax=Baekduia soli TaxID=496014 RepID=A0A5B8U3Z2_9ACTN|nr:hypothetical protein [Baekduia soli]QEC47774.1 hypothetical protein FSW04_09450 [Baekduia soli]
MDDPARGPMSFLRLPPGSSMRLRTVVIAAGGVLDHDPAAWHDALVVVARGAVEVEACDGTRRPFGEGAVLSLADAGVRRLRNPGSDGLVLVALSRRRLAGDPGR